jgi:hypothetical protein
MPAWLSLTDGSVQTPEETMSQEHRKRISDYAASGLSIWQATLDQGKKRSKSERGPITIRWRDKAVQTADVFQVPRRGTIRLEFIHSTTGIRQGLM